MTIETISPAQAHARASQGARLVDIRDPHERDGVAAAGSVSTPVSELRDTAVKAWDRDEPVMLICERGIRSQTAVRMLRSMGYRHVVSVDGGTVRWHGDGLPLLRPAPDDDFLERYSRHIRLAEVGVAGQRRLESSHALLIGAGGLGSPAAFYLAAAGVGTITIVDDDVVDRSNLQRQLLHVDDAVGELKVQSARSRLAALNPRTKINSVARRLTAENVDDLVSAADVVIDGSDNFAARYLLNDACVRRSIPLVHGAIHRFDGMIAVIHAGAGRPDAPCYRCLFPEQPPAEAAPNCAEIGVLGVLPGVIGTLQATEALKLLLGLGASSAGHLLCFNALEMSFRKVALTPDPDCPACSRHRHAAGPAGT